MHDPCKGPGRDDSCGWFMRSYHGDQKVMEAITKRFEEDWDRVFKSDSGNSYMCGYFCPNGDPHFSVHGIALNLFFIAINQVFKCDGRTSWKRSRLWMQSHLFDLLLFAENTTDSLHDEITRKFAIGCGEPHTEQSRKERIRTMASIIYGYILRDLRPWYRHPRWHIHHWRLQVHPWQWLKRGLFDRCCMCGKRFKFGSTAMSDWNGTKIWHDSCDDTLKQPVKTA